MEIYQKKNRYKPIMFLMLLAVVIFIGLYFILDVRAKTRADAERARIEQEERASKKIEKKVFGQSNLGRPIEGYEIGNGPIAIILIAAIHGNEMGTADLLNQLVEEIKTHPELISRQKKIIVLPVANPDGYYDRTDKLNANEVNLNLNFPTTGWENYGPEGTYAGPQPWSEIESRIIKQLVEQYQPQLMIDFHALGALVSPESTERSIRWARWYAEQTGYDYYDVWNYFGTETKWFVETTGHPAFTVELTKYLQSDWEINKKALLELVSSDQLPIFDK